MGHVLFDGPPGLAKTLTIVLQNELTAMMQMISGPEMSCPAHLLPFLTNATDGSLLFIDEIHKMPREVEDFICHAMNDFCAEIVLGKEKDARTLSVPLKRFTVIGATTRSDLLGSSMRNHFKIHEHLNENTVEEITTVREDQLPNAEALTQNPRGISRKRGQKETPESHRRLV